MKIELRRIKESYKSTISDVYIDGNYFCHGLEDPVRDLGPNGEGKIHGETAIPAGTYQVIINMSPRFGKFMPRLLNVPFFDGILIHKGNKPEDTEGCILIGHDIGGDDEILHSTATWEAFFSRLSTALACGEEAWITITNDFQE
jgi:hypothetical protein